VRKYIGARLRFEIFKRDNFTCQYCGRKPLSCEIEVDHKTPVCKGGKDSASNLVTSCVDCNTGKGKIPLSVCRMPGVAIHVSSYTILRDLPDSALKPIAAKARVSLGKLKFFLDEREIDESERIRMICVCNDEVYTSDGKARLIASLKARAARGTP
jgi:hypothetical protein